MRSRWILFQLEMKKFIKILPAILLETLLSALVLLGVGAYATKAVYGEKLINEIKVGIVAQGDDKTAAMLIRFVGAMDSMKDTAVFELLPDKEAEEKLQKGDIYAAVILPDGIIDSIISGKNIPAKILTGNAYSKVETDVFTQLSQAGASLLTTAQAGIYAADTFCIENGRADMVKQTENYLNGAYLKYALERSSLFREKEVTAIKGVNLVEYYTISLLFAFLSFAGLSFGRYVQVDMGEREKMIRSHGISELQQYLIETAAFACIFAFLGTLISVPLYLFVMNYGKSTFVFAPTWIFIMVIWFLAGIFLRGLFQIVGNQVGNIGVCFVILMALMLAAGVFIPQAFLPIGEIGNYTFYKDWMEAMAAALQGRFDVPLAGRLVLALLFFSVSGVLAAVCREKRWRRK